jgi:predicted ester cyclase
MDPETLKDKYRRWLLEVWGAGRYEVADELLHVDLVDHKRYDGQPDGRAGDVWAAEMVRRIPDLRFVPDLVVSDGVHVAGRWTMTGTNTGMIDLFGLPPDRTVRDDDRTGGVPRPGRPVRRGLASGGPARHARATRAPAATNAHATGRPPQRMAL